METLYIQIELNNKLIEKKIPNNSWNKTDMIGNGNDTTLEMRELLLFLAFDF